MMMRLITSALLLATVASSWTPLRGGNNDVVDTPFDDLLKCMWNGTTVTACHALSCKWCHSAFSDICVTDEYATNLDGKVFKCEGSSNDDDYSTTDDDAVPTPTPTTHAPTADPDDVHPIDDDDPDHGANKEYFDKLMKCMKNLDKGGCEKNDHDDDTNDNGDAAAVKCTWCAYQGGGMCFSHQAAKQMDGGYYTCDLEESTTWMETLSMGLLKE